MELDEVSLAIGKLQAGQDGTARDVAELKNRTEGIDDKLDKLLARTERTRLTFKHWAMIFGGSSLGGGGIAHILRKILE